MKFCGVEFKNPMVIASSPLTSKLEMLLLLLGIALLVLVDVLHECGLHLRAWVDAAPRPVRWAVYEFAIFAFLLMASFYSNTGFLYARF